VVEGFLDYPRQVAEQAIAFAAVRRSVHDGKSFRFEIGQRPEDAFGLAGSPIARSSRRCRWRDPNPSDKRIPDSGTLENLWSSVLSPKKPSTRISRCFESAFPARSFKGTLEKLIDILKVLRGN
jgi:hypothetical protein